MKTLVLIIIVVSAIALFSQEILIIDGSPCGSHGSAKKGSREYDLNVSKNRFTFPASSDFQQKITLKDLIATDAGEDKFSIDKAVEITGYVLIVKSGSKETCNCKTTDPDLQDTHIVLTPSKEESGPESRLIVEVTPRTRIKMNDSLNIDWSTKALQKKIKGHIVKIRGWLFYDKIHEPQSFSTNPENSSGTNWRATPWEVHPVTGIDVIK